MPAPRSHRRARIAVLASSALALAGFQLLSAPVAQASVSDKISTFPYSQDWSSLTAGSTWGDFTGVEGFSTGVSIAAANLPNSTDVGTLTAEGTLTSSLVQRTGTTPNGDSSGGILLYPNAANKTVALSATGSITTPLLAFHLDTTGQTGIGVAYDVQDLDNSADDQPTRVALQYRVGTSGPYTNVPAGYVPDATMVSNSTVLTTHVSAALPANANNASDVYVRVMTLDNATGSNEHVGIDNISFTTGGGASPLALASPGAQTTAVGDTVSLQLAASGGSGSYTYSATGLPPGLDISSSGLITGSPTTTTGSPFHVTATVNDGTTTSDAGFDWTINPAPSITPIASIQGSGDASPLVGQTVTTQGVVTAAYPTGGFNGFYLQTPGSPDTPGASDAVFVFGSAAAATVAVGDSVKVTGKVSEFNGTTEVAATSASAVTKLGTSLGTVAPLSVPWTDLDTDAKREAHEGELVMPQGDFTVTDNYNINFYGEIELAAGDRMLEQPTDVGTPGSAAAVAAAAYNTAHQVFLDDGASATYSATSNSGTPLPWLTPSTPVSDGAQTTFHQPVVLEFRNSQWNFQPQHQLTGDGSAIATFSDVRSGKTAPSDVGSEVRLATFNMENFFTTTGNAFVAAGLGICTYYKDRAGAQITDDTCTTTGGGPGPRGAATDASYQRQLSKELVGINGLGASVVSLEEVENAVKFGEDRDATVSALVDALNAEDGAGTWAFVPSPAAADLPPVAEQDVIRTAFIYKPADITPVGVSHVLADDSDDGEPFSIAREPMAQGFKAAGASDSDAFMVVANHLKSKGPDADPLFSDCGPGGTVGAGGTSGDTENTDPVYDQGAFNCSRVHQVHDMWAWAQQRAQDLGTDRIFLVGDFNAYDHEDPLEYLYGQGFTDLGSTYDPAHSSYSYGGLEGSLDHVLASSAALDLVTGATIWQIDAQEAVAFAYSRFNYNVTQLYDGTTPWATSDHDPEVVGLQFPVDVATTTTADDATAEKGTDASVHVAVTAASGTAVPSGTVTLTEGNDVVGSGDLGPDGTVDVSVATGSLSVGAHTLTATYGGSDGFDGSFDTLTLTVTSAKATATVASGDVTVGYGHATEVVTHVRGAGARPTGTVEVFEGGTSLGHATLGKTSVATVRIAAGALSVGSHSLRAVYSGDATYAGGEDTLMLAVVATPTTVRVADQTKTYGSVVALPVTLALPSTVTPSGTLTVSEGGTQLASVPVTSHSVRVTLPGGTLTVGDHTLDVFYSGDSNIGAGSTTVHVTITKASPLVRAAATPARPRVGQDTSLKVTVTVAGAPVSGDVSITVDGGSPVTTMLSGGIATVDLGSFASADAHIVKVDYAGNGNVAAGTTTLAVNVRA